MVLVSLAPVEVIRTSVLDADVACCNPDHPEPVAATVLMRTTCPGCGARGRGSWPCCDGCARHLEELRESQTCHCGHSDRHGIFWTRVQRL